MIKAKYTVVLKTLLDDPECRAIIEDALSRYPLYAVDKQYDLIPSREELNERLLNNYKYREIGFETVGRFLDELEITMANIMPYYNEMFKTVVTMADLPSPFDNVDFVETFKQTTTGTSKTTSESENTSESKVTDNTTNNTKMESADKSVESRQPQGQLPIPATSSDGVAGVDLVTYADKASWNKSESDSTATSNGESNSEGTTTGTASSEEESTGSVEHTFTKVGNQGVNTYAHDMNEFRTAIIDVVDQIINDRRIQELFMLVY